MSASDLFDKLNPDDYDQLWSYLFSRANRPIGMVEAPKHIEPEAAARILEAITYGRDS
jgi:hypothetical protein